MRGGGTKISPLRDASRTELLKQLSTSLQLLLNAFLYIIASVFFGIYPHMLSSRTRTVLYSPFQISYCLRI
jgi:hypothetical protein